MRCVPLVIVLMLAAASPAAAQSCATLSGGLDCSGAPAQPPATSSKAPAKTQSPKSPSAKSHPAKRPASSASRREGDVDVHGSAETTVSNHGASATATGRVIDSHGFMEFNLFGSRAKCRRAGYSTLCD